MTTTMGSLDLNAFSDLYNDSNQYFWFESDATATYGAGAHVTLVPDTTFISNPTGQNVLINTDGFSVRNGLLPMMTLDNDSLDFNIVDTTAGTYTTTATFTATGAQIGQSGSSHSVIDEYGQRFYATDGTTQLANIGYDKGVNATGGNSIAPYYTLGVRKTTTRAYSLFSTYAVGDVCIYDEKVYVCIHAITTPESWDASHWQYYIGNYSVAEGLNTTASGFLSHAEGYNTIASGSNSHAEGSNTIASGGYCHAEGYNTIASGSNSHAEGSNTIASGGSHAEGVNARASGPYSHAEGGSTIASGTYSHAQNTFTVATGTSQTVIGRYNAATVTGSGTDADPYVYTDVGNYAFIIGNGIMNTTTKRSNALTVDWDGNVDAAGSVITPAKYNDAYNAGSSAGYSVTVPSLAGSTYLGQAIRLATVASMSKFPIFNGFDISGTGTARIHTLGHYIYKSTYNGQEYWTAYIKMRNDNTTAISNFTVTAYIAWV